MRPLLLSCARTGLEAEIRQSEPGVFVDAATDVGIYASPRLSCEQCANPPDVKSPFDATPYCRRGRDCVPLIYIDEYADYLPFNERALAVWEADSCTRLCFGEPRAGAELPYGRDGAISFGRWVVGPEEEYLRRRRCWASVSRRSRREIERSLRQIRRRRCLPPLIAS